MALDRNTSLTYLGHATVLIETPGGKRVLIDPWLEGNPACPQEWKSPERLGKLDLILLTHLHNDHAGDAEAVVKANPEAAVVAIFEACNWLGGKGAKNLKPMNKGGSQTVAGIEITMTHAFHSSSFHEPDGAVAYGGEPAGYILRLENGFSLYAAGDTALFGDMALLRDLYSPELALLPIGDLFTMGPREAAHAIRLLGVAHVLPIHYATFPALTGTPEALRQHTADIPNLQIHALKPGETLR
ncbi:MAG TPA: metal-dependent hydrolase [Chthonomonadaceae bacterium]|nr:metal-dependent hydrolase [Chthonomonadaceae bacterium]